MDRAQEPDLIGTVVMGLNVLLERSTRSSSYYVPIGIGVPLLDLVLPPCYDKDGFLNVAPAISSLV